MEFKIHLLPADRVSQSGRGSKGFGGAQRGPSPHPHYKVKFPVPGSFFHTVSRVGEPESRLSFAIAHQGHGGGGGGGRGAIPHPGHATTFKMGEGGCTCKTNCILLLPSSRFVGHQKCNNKECWGRKRDFIQRKNHGNLFAENHDLTLRIHKMFQSSVSFAPHMFITFTRSSYLPDHANHLPEIRKTLNPKWVITVSHQGWYRYIELPGQLKSLSKSEASLLRYEQLNTPLFPSVPALPKMHPHPSRSFVWV